MTADDMDAWLDVFSPDELLAIACPPPPRSLRPGRTEPVGALVLWREELRRGVRTVTTFDALHAAACCELNAFDAISAGLPLIASSWFGSAERTIIKAAKAKQARQPRSAA